MLSPRIARWLPVALLAASSFAWGEHGPKRHLEVLTTPDKAFVELASGAFLVSCLSPCVLQAPAGKYRLTISHEGYKRHERALQLSADYSVTVALEREPPGVIDVRAALDDIATGATVYLNGVAIGAVPRAVYAPSGEQTLRVVRPGFDDFQTTFRLLTGERHVVTVTMQRERPSGGLSIGANVPGARVLVDGVPRGGTIDHLAEGLHLVEVLKDGYAPWRQQVRVVVGPPQQVVVQLVPLVVKYHLQLLSSPPGATGVVIASDATTARCVTPCVFELAAGSYRVQLALAGRPPVERPLTLLRDSSLTVTIPEPSAPPPTVSLPPTVSRPPPVTPPPTVTPPPMVAPSSPTVLDLRVGTDRSAAGALATLNGAALGPLPRAIVVPPGSHQLSVARPGYETHQSTIEVAPGQRRIVEVTLRPALPKTGGGLLVSTNVAGAAVLVDGVERGIAPIRIDDLALGVHELELHKAGYAPWHRIVTVAERVSTVAATLVALESPPTAPSPPTVGEPDSAAAVALAEQIRIQERCVTYLRRKLPDSRALRDAEARLAELQGQPAIAPSVSSPPVAPTAPPQPPDLAAELEAQRKRLVYLQKKKPGSKAVADAEKRVAELEQQQAEAQRLAAEHSRAELEAQAAAAEAERKAKEEAERRQAAETARLAAERAAAAAAAVEQRRATERAEAARIAAERERLAAAEAARRAHAEAEEQKHTRSRRVLKQIFFHPISGSVGFGLTTFFVPKYVPNPISSAATAFSSSPLSQNSTAADLCVTVGARVLWLVGDFSLVNLADAPGGLLYRASVGLAPITLATWLGRERPKGLTFLEPFVLYRFYLGSRIETGSGHYDSLAFGNRFSVDISHVSVGLELSGEVGLGNTSVQVADGGMGFRRLVGFDWAFNLGLFFRVGSP